MIYKKCIQDKTYPNQMNNMYNLLIEKNRLPLTIIQSFLCKSYLGTWQDNLTNTDAINKAGKG